MEMRKEEWDKFVLEAGGCFLQSWQWGEFQKTLGRKVVRVEKDGMIAQFVRISLPAGMFYWYAPRGPIGEGVEDRLKEMVQDGVFLRIEPEKQEFVSPNAVKVFDQQPSHTLILDLSKTEEELLKGMHPKTRYNIRLAERKGVEVEIMETNHKEYKKAFVDLLKETAKRDKFSLHLTDYYSKLCDSIGDIARLAVAKFQNKILAIHFLILFGDTITYLFGASSSEYRDFMAPHLLQWRSIQFAKSKGFKQYDFWGISDTNPAWRGLTRFKRGFGGKEVKYPGTFDVPFQKCLYNMYRVGRRIRRTVKFCSHSSTDRTQVSGTCDEGSIPSGSKNTGSALLFPDLQ